LSKRNPSSPILRSEKHNKSRNVILTDASQFSGGYERSGNLIQDYADLLGVKTNELENIRLYELINEWMGTPYAYGGLSKKGIDCSGFASLIISEVYGKNLPRSSEAQASVVKRKYEKQLKEGDLLFFSFGSARINHVGIYLHNNKFAHASTSKGVIISDLKDTWYYKSFKRAGTVK
jgi:lipoprotein Spr